MNIYDKKYTPLFFILLTLLLIEPLQASAYIDPGTGSFFIQMLIASAVGLSVSLRMFWRNIKGFFMRKSSSKESISTASGEAYDAEKKS